MNTECLQRCVTICFTPHDYPDVAHSDANVHVVAPHSAPSPMHFVALTAPIPYTWVFYQVIPYKQKKGWGAFHWDEIYIFEPLTLWRKSKYLVTDVESVIAAANCFLVVIVTASLPARLHPWVKQFLSRLWQRILKDEQRARIHLIMTATNENRMREYQYNYYQWKEAGEQSESVSIELMEISPKKACCYCCCCVLKEKGIQSTRIVSQGESLLLTDSCCWTYWPKHLGIVCLSEK